MHLNCINKRTSDEMKKAKISDETKAQRSVLDEFLMTNNDFIHDYARWGI